jgi:hypothetical protein
VMDRSVSTARNLSFFTICESILKVSFLFSITVNKIEI